MHKVVLLLTAAIKELTTELRKGNKEAAQRNGHLGEQNVQIIKLVSEHNKEVANIGGSIMDAVSNVKEQHVEHQHVDNVNVEE